MDPNGIACAMNNVERINGESAIELGAEPDFRVGALLVRPASRRVDIDGKTEMIEPRVMQALIALSRRKGEVVSREQLIDECWSGRVVGEDAINRCIAKLRRLASASTFELETIPRVGYRLVAASEPKLTQAKSAQEVVEQPAPVQPQIVSKRAMSRRRKWALIGGSITIFTVACFFSGMFFWMQILGASSFSEVFELTSFTGRPQVAVLPFDAIGLDSDSHYLADAIPAEINNKLVNLGIQVVSPAVAFQYRGERKAQAGAELGPRYVIDGSLRIEGDKLYVIVRLDSAMERVSMWSQTFETDIHAANNLPDQIASAMASLQVFLAARRNAQVRAAPNVVAGTMRINELMRTGDDLGAYIAAKELLREKPGVNAYQHFYGITAGGALDVIPMTERAKVLADARDVTNSAERMSPYGAPFAKNSVLPSVDWVDRDRILRTSIEKQPANSSLRYLYALLLSHVGRIDEAIAVAHEGNIIDPLSSANMLTYAGVLDTAGKNEEADVLFARAERLWPGLELTQLLRYPGVLARGDVKTATAMLNDPLLQGVLNPPAEQRPFAAILLALETRKPADIEAVERECSDPRKLARRRSGPCLIALVRLNRVDTFFELAPKYFPEQRGATAAERDARWLEDPLAWRNLRLLFRADMTALRTDPRMIPIFERMGLVDYWRTTGKWPDFCAAEPKSVCAQIKSSVRSH
jgi:DNA-binding winged helix-turn-helix (wHTH) protein/TolB-like protein